MSSNVILDNQTVTDVIFGLWSAAHNHGFSKQVPAKSQDSISLEHDDARIVGAWTDSNHLYPNNLEPFTAGAYFDGGNFTVTLTEKGIKIT